MRRFFEGRAGGWLLGRSCLVGGIFNSTVPSFCWRRAPHTAWFLVVRTSFVVAPEVALALSVDRFRHGVRPVCVGRCYRGMFLLIFFSHQNCCEKHQSMERVQYLLLQNILLLLLLLPHCCLAPCPCVSAGSFPDRRRKRWRWTQRATPSYRASRDLRGTPVGIRDLRRVQGDGRRARAHGV